MASDKDTSDPKRQKAEPGEKNTVPAPTKMGQGILTPAVEGELSNYFDNPANARPEKPSQAQVRQSLNEYFDDPVNARPAQATAPAEAAQVAEAAAPAEQGFVNRMATAAGQKYGTALVNPVIGTAAKVAGGVAKGATQFAKGTFLPGVYELANEYVPHASNDTWYGKATNIARDIGSDTAGMMTKAQIPAALAAATGVGAAAIPEIEAAGLFGGLAKGAYNAYNKYKAGGYDAHPQAVAQAQEQLAGPKPWESGYVNGAKSVGVLRNPEPEHAGDFTRNPDTGKLSETVRDDAGYNTGTISEAKNANGTPVRTLYSPDGQYLGYSYGAPPMQKEFDAEKQKQRVADAAEQLGWRAYDQRQADDAAQRERANNFFADVAAKEGVERASGHGVSSDPTRNVAAANQLVSAVERRAAITGEDPSTYLGDNVPAAIRGLAMAQLNAHSNGGDLSPVEMLTQGMALTPYQPGNHRQQEAARFTRENLGPAVTVDKYGNALGFKEQALAQRERDFQAREADRTGSAQQKKINVQARALNQQISKLDSDIRREEAKPGMSEINKPTIDQWRAQREAAQGKLTQLLEGQDTDVAAPAGTPAPGEQKEVAPEAPLKVTSQADYDKLPKGAKFVDAKGNSYTKK